MYLHSLLKFLLKRKTLEEKGLSLHQYKYIKLPDLTIFTIQTPEYIFSNLGPQDHLTLHRNRHFAAVLQGSFPQRHRAARPLVTQNDPLAKHLLGTDKVTWDGGIATLGQQPGGRGTQRKHSQPLESQGSLPKDADTRHARARAWGPAGALTLGESWKRGHRAGVSQGGGPQPHGSLLRQPLPPGALLSSLLLGSQRCQKRAIAALLFQPTAQSCPTAKGKKTNKQD